MSRDALAEFVEATAKKFDIPGVAVGVWVDGRELIACHGVTSLDNPLPVGGDTLFVLGSVTKTYTATAIMRLVEAGRGGLEATGRPAGPAHRRPPAACARPNRAAGSGGGSCSFCRSYGCRVLASTSRGGCLTG